MKRRAIFNLAVFLVGIGVFASGALALWVATLRIPELDAFESRIVKQSTKIYDRTGKILLFDVHENVQRTVVSFDKISRHAKNAAVAIEDAEFYEHRGIKPTAIVRAVFVNLGSGGFRQGGSTITQQVVKNSLLTSEKLLSRKLKEWALSLKLEQVASKEEILASYLNETPYGGNLYGIEEASVSYFGKSASDLSLAEAAYLSALPQAPTYYSPYGNNKERLEARKALVLNRMLENNFITPDEHEQAQKETVIFLPRADRGIRAPHFVMFVREYLESTYGNRALEEEGLRIITTLDYSLQEKAEEIVLRHALENTEKFKATNASLVAVDPKTGQVLVMVGSRDYFDDSIDGKFNVSLAHRQPGSAFKPFVYATAFKAGYTPDTVVFDLRTEFSTQCSPQMTPLSSDAVCYNPVNYDNAFRGPITFRNALAQSVNIPAVKVLYLAGLDESLRTARDLGINSLTNKEQYGLTLVLGGGEVSPMDMASAYGVFANNGIRNPANSILRIEDSEGAVLEEFKTRPERALEENIARTISDILSDNEARAPAFGGQSYLHFPERDVAVKTGTTNNYRDAWIVGYTPSISVATWAGNNDNSPMEKRVAGFIVAPMWNEFMKAALSESKNEPFDPPKLDSGELRPVLRGVWQGGEIYLVDSVSGKLATELTPTETLEEHVINDVHSVLYWVNKRNPRGPRPARPQEDPQFSLWEAPVLSWAISNGFSGGQDEAPTETDDIHTKDAIPEVVVVGARDDAPYGQNEPVDVRLDISSKHPIIYADFYVNGRYLGRSDSKTPSVRFVPSEIENIDKKNILRVVVSDKFYNKGESEVSFLVDF